MEKVVRDIPKHSQKQACQRLLSSMTAREVSTAVASLCSGILCYYRLGLLSALPDLRNAVEVNVACPNVPGKPLVGYDFPQLSAVVEKIASHAPRLRASRTRKAFIRHDHRVCHTKPVSVAT